MPNENASNNITTRIPAPMADAFEYYPLVLPSQSELFSKSKGMPPLFEMLQARQSVEAKLCTGRKRLAN